MKMHYMKSDQVRPTEWSASQQASWDVFFFLLPSSQVLVLQTKGRVYLASADSTMSALWLEKHKRRTCLCDPTHLSETTSSIRAFYPWRDRAGGLASAETRHFVVFFKTKMEGL